VTGDPRFSVASGNLVFGPGARHELGEHAAELGLRRVLLIVDPVPALAGAVDEAAECLRATSIDVEVYPVSSIEPTDASFKAAAEVAARGDFDGFVALGGGSTMDTAKAADLYATWPDELLSYVNAPIGKGLAPPGPLRPLICLPTTAGTGSETTGVAVFDLPELHAKTGIAHRFLRPTLAIVDPELTRSMPPMVTAASGFDVLCHALESYTALPSGQRPAPVSAAARPAYQGANPFSDVWAERALVMVASALPRAFTDPHDLDARAEMSLAATFAGIGFGNAGVHLAHGMSYAISGMVREYVAPGYAPDHPLVPHGISVVLGAPAVFRFTAVADPVRHLRAAELIGADVSGVSPDHAGEFLAATIAELMHLTGVPMSLSEVGYDASDIPALVEATLPQHRVTKLSPRPVGRTELEALFLDAL